MGMLDLMAARVAAGETVQFRPTGSSMMPLIRSRDLVTVAPVDPANVEAGDIVLAKVAGTVYLHLVSATDHARGRVQISNNRGRVNGWTSYAKVFGICTSVAGIARPATSSKIRLAGVEAVEGTHPLLNERMLAVVDEARQRVGTADPEQLVEYLAIRGFGFMECIAALRESGVGLGDAKWIVHGSAPFAAEKSTREEFWVQLHQAAQEAVDNVEDKRAVSE